MKDALSWCLRLLSHGPLRIYENHFDFCQTVFDGSLTLMMHQSVFDTSITQPESGCTSADDSAESTLNQFEFLILWMWPHFTDMPLFLDGRLYFDPISDFPQGRHRWHSLK